jgi:hypothetical protein
MIGIVSSGPDGVAGSRDDVASWTMADVTDALAGLKWVGKRASTATSGARTNSVKPVIKDVDGDGIPDERKP